MRGVRRGLPAAALVALAACSVDTPVAASGGLSGTVTVFAAASLTGAFEQLGEQLEADHPGLTVVLNLGASSALAQAVVSGAPADVFAAASPSAMRVVTDAGDASGPRVFARNRLQIAVPQDNPAGVDALADLAREELTVALCAPQVPCGAASEQAFAAAGLIGSPDTLEQDVKAALSKVVLGEVDAALVYRTDVLAAGGDVRGIAFPEADEAVNDYPVVALTDAPNAAAARAFVELVLSPAGQRALVDAGFDPA